MPDRKEIDIAAQKAGNSSYPMGKIFDKTVPALTDKVNPVRPIRPGASRQKLANYGSWACCLVL